MLPAFRRTISATTPGAQVCGSEYTTAEGPSGPQPSTSDAAATAGTRTVVEIVGVPLHVSDPSKASMR